ncbi:S8 family serine peptidase [Salipaludibacillus agaradhaerens]|nr:S8 family serine peptidase [Salipaludibacillus agaradhaerens]
MLRNKQRQQGIIWMMVVVLIMPMIMPQIVSATSNGTSTSYLEEIDQDAPVEVADHLIDEFDDEEYVTFLLKMKEQVDTDKIATDVAENNIQVAGTTDLTLAQRTAIVSELRATATESQVEVKDFLLKEKENGNVQEIESFYIVNALAVTANKETLEALESYAEIDKILPNETRELHETTRTHVEDENAPSELPQTSDPEVEWNIEQIEAPDVWEMGIDGSGIVIASIDTGVEWDHPALINQYRGFDASTGEVNHEFNWFDATVGEDVPYDDLDHGTHVTGTMVGVEEDGSNKIGVAPGAQWIGVKAFTDDGGTDMDLLAAGEWILAPTDEDGNPHPEYAPDIVNNSWGGGPGLDEWYRPMVQNWRAAGIFPEFSAGNTSLTNPGGLGSVANPANYPESFATGATNANNELASFSLQGPSPYDEIKPEVSAPGVNIRSAVSGGGYEGGWNGTSMAGPHTSALAALLLQVDSSLTVDELEDIIMTTSTPATDSQFPETPNNGYGAGIINAYEAVTAVSDGLGRLSGSVLQEGEDSEPPVLQHTPPEEVFEGIALPLEVSAEDNVSVTSVILMYEDDGEWKELETQRKSGDYRAGIYKANMPADAIIAPEITYYWVVEDFGGHTVESDVYTVEVHDSVTTGYVQDFETYPAGWLSFGQNNSWEWGRPKVGPSSAYSGDHVYGTNLAGDYADDMDATLILPPVQVPDKGDFFLEYHEWFEFEINYDYGYVVVSTDDMDTWDIVRTVNGVSDEWESAYIDLSDYAGERIIVGFNAYSDFLITESGWYIDDVSLTDEVQNTDGGKMELGIINSGLSLYSSFGSTANGFGRTNGLHLGRTPTNPAEHVPPKGKERELIAPEQKTDQRQKDKDSSGDEQTTAGLPLAATVKVNETGRRTQTNPASGAFSLTHPAGQFTVRAEAYGFHPSEKEVAIEADETAAVHFMLDELGVGSVSGAVLNEITEEPVEGATLMLKEDPRISAVKSDEEGRYSIEAYEGTYTLKVVAPSYYSYETEITIEEGDMTIADIALTPFIGYPGEISYDDGTAENARVFYEAGNGWAVRMSLEEGQEKALLTGGLLHFWDTEWPQPGGTDFQLAVYDAEGNGGSPGEKIAGPIDAEALRDGSWTHVDLSQEGIIVDSDFYLVYIQTDDNPHAPGLATDENGPFSERNWEFVGGKFSQTPADEGNYMIRALVDYEVTVPEITSPEDGYMTNDEIVTVEGNGSRDVDMIIYNQGEEAGNTTTDDKGFFSVDITLNDGENKLTAIAETPSGSSGESDPITVILDQEAPELEILSPKEGDKLNSETVRVEGSATDEYLDHVTVNGAKAELDEEGLFSHRIMLDEGENEITVKAVDGAGNESVETLTVYANFGKYVLSDITPVEDTELKAGETVLVSFHAEEGLDSSFVIRMPLTNLPSSNRTGNATELPMREQSPGYYVGYYTATSNVKANGAEVEVIARDDFDNEVRAVADGKLFINVD